MATSYPDEEMINVCVPGVSDPLSGTSWQSAFIDSTAMTAGVTSSTYQVTFAPGSVVQSTGTETAVSGVFTATFTQVYGASALNYAGCNEVTTFTGGTWTDATTSSKPMSGGLVVSDANGSTNRSGCTSPGDDTEGETNLYDDAVDMMSGAGFDVSGTTMTLSECMGVTPYADGSTWSFTKM
jgi:hypothetical protein